MCSEYASWFQLLSLKTTSYMLERALNVIYWERFMSLAKYVTTTIKGTAINMFPLVLGIAVGKISWICEENIFVEVLFFNLREWLLVKVEAQSMFRLVKIYQYFYREFLTLSWRRHIDTICSANQWTGFDMITASVMKGLRTRNNFLNSWQVILFQTIYISYELLRCLSWFVLGLMVHFYSCFINQDNRLRLSFTAICQFKVRL